MPGYPCCCRKCFCNGDRITPDGTVTWIEHTVDGGVITKTNHEGPCKTYWVDSVSGGGAESGSGTEVDPWTNFNTVFSDACIKHICTHSTAPDKCPKVKVLVKGTIDYAINGGSYNFGRNLVIEPWGGGTVTISVSGTIAVSSCAGVIWKNCTVISINAVGIINHGYGFYGCNNSTFDTCNGDGTGSAGVNYGYGYGFHSCNNSTFDTCNGDGTGSYSGCHCCGYGFHSCFYSTFNACDGTGTGVGTGNYSCYLLGYGFYGCNNSTFDTCNGDGTGVGTGSYNGVGRGFYQCTSSTFSSCTGTGTGNVPGITDSRLTYSYGFQSCFYSTFNACDGTGTLVGTPINGRICGFRDNTGASFINCTTSASACFGTGCPANCDI